MSLATGAIAEILFKIRCQRHGRDDNLLEASVLDSYQAPYKFKLEVTCDIRTTWFMITVNTTNPQAPQLTCKCAKSVVLSATCCIELNRRIGVRVAFQVAVHLADK